MLFSSSIFIFLFLPASLLGYQLLARLTSAAPRRTILLSWLSLTSLFFYGYWNPHYLFLLGASILLNFLFSQRLGDPIPDRTQSRWLLTAIVTNLLALMYFKYLFPTLNFFHDHNLLPHAFSNVVLPLGISFFTFTQIAYLIDLRQGIAKRQGIIPYSVFVTFFPHLIAGPIIHPRELMPQLDQGHIQSLRSDDITLGFTWFILGLAKKVLIADRIAPLADVLYAHPHSAGFATAWLGSLCYTFQLYFDFSGYSDMALGIARMFSLRFPINFNSPFKAECIIDFWQRWHMTLSRYLNEYLYTPISRFINGRRYDRGQKVSRKAQATPSGFLEMVAFPTMSTMFLAGVWHGAGLQFLVYGVIHGIYLTINHAWRLWTPKGTPLHQRIPGPAMVLLTFLAVHISFVFFRAASVHDGAYVVGSLFGLHHGPSFAAFPGLAAIPSISRFLTHATTTAAIVAVCFAIVWFTPNTQQILNQTTYRDEPNPRIIFPRLRWQPTLVWSLTITALFALSILLLDASTRFLYFQF